MRESRRRPARGRSVDRRLFDVMNHPRGPAVDGFFKTVTELGSLWASIGAAAVLARNGHRRPALDALGAALVTWGFGQGLKRATARPRPYDALDGARLLIDRPAGTSWPSSHPAVLLAFVTVAGRDLGTSGGMRAGLAGLAGVVGLSRVYLGVHYPSDVVGGLVLGRATADVWSRLVSPLVLGHAPLQRRGSRVQ